jgi:hypothetical protein
MIESSFMTQKAAQYHTSVYADTDNNTLTILGKRRKSKEQYNNISRRLERQRTKSIWS